MTTLFLILHKVRGEPAFDIAQRACPTNGESPCQANCGCYRDGKCLMEEEWIIPTSGHTAHPFRTWRLDNLADTSDINKFGLHTMPWALDDLPEEWPDHYPDASAPEPTGPLSGLLAKLGLRKEIKRRKING